MAWLPLGPPRRRGAADGVPGVPGGQQDRGGGAPAGAAANSVPAFLRKSARPSCTPPSRHSARRDPQNRIIFITDAQPNAGDTSESGLLARIKALSADGIYTTLIGGRAGPLCRWQRSRAAVAAGGSVK